MNLGRRLIEAGLVTEADINRALERQKNCGGTLGQNLIALELIKVEALDRFVTPLQPTLKLTQDLGINPNLLLGLMLKIISVHALRTAPEIAAEIKLAPASVTNLLKVATDRMLLESAGGGALSVEIQYNLTRKGREWVADAFEHSLYVGPAPVSLAAYKEQMRSQQLTTDRVDAATLAGSLEGLVLPADLIDQLGPAVNSGRSVLLYGPPGNGKTSIAAALARSFRHTIFVPYAIEIDGQIIKVFDPEIHQRTDVARQQNSPLLKSTSALLLPKLVDERWVPCRRPIARCSGELSLDMLDLAFNASSKIYEAPIQLKATAGVLLIDDFGRQKADPRDLLNRWIVPLEKGYDYLTLLSGRKFDVPFDALVVFLTNLHPDDIMDSATLRRIPYKIPVRPLAEDQLRVIFEKACFRHGIDFDAVVIDTFLTETYRSHKLDAANYHPDFIIRHVVLRCRFEGRPSRLSLDLLRDAADQLTIH